MNTTTAAAKAHVTTATIRTWCRFGAVNATKTNGQWVIDEASLLRRINLGAPAKTTPTLSIETMLAIGGSRWTKAGRDRVYLNDWAPFAGIEASRYNTGNVSSATFDGDPIANGRIGALLGAISKVYYDAADGTLHAQHHGADRVDIRTLAGARYTVNLVQAAFDGIRAAVAAL
jgi:hypothetical protein